MLGKRLFTKFMEVLPEQVELYTFASKFWDGHMNKTSCTTAIKNAIKDKSCPKHDNPFASLENLHLCDASVK